MTTSHPGSSSPRDLDASFRPAVAAPPPGVAEGVVACAGAGKHAISHEATSVTGYTG
jgi:hypothetical protein